MKSCPSLQIVVISALLLAVLTGPAVAAPQQSTAVRDRMRKILGSPEFRNLIPLKREGRPRTFTGRGGMPTDGRQEFRRGPDGNPVIIRDEKGRARIGKDERGRAVIEDPDGRKVVLRDQNKQDFAARDGKPDEEVLKDRLGRNVVVRDENDKARIGKDAQGRAVIAKDEFDRDVILRDENGRDVVVRDGAGRQGVQRDEFGRRIIFRDEKGRAKIGRDQQGRAILGKDENGRDVVLRDGNNRNVAARNMDPKDGVMRDRQRRPIIFRDENERAVIGRNEDKRGNLGRGPGGRDVEIRDEQGRDVFVFDDEEFRKLPKHDPADGPAGDGNRRFGQNGRNDGDNGQFNPDRGNRGGNGGNRDADFAPPDTGSSSSSGPEIRSTGFGAAASGFLQVLGWIITAIVAAAMLFMIGKGIVALAAWFRDRNKDISETADTAVANDPLEPDKSPGELPADVYIQRARELAREGKFREAIAQLLLGGMSNLERAGVVKYRKGLTHRDYVRASRGQRPVYESMKAMVRLYEPLGFGRRTPTPQHFEKSLAAYEAGFRAAPATG